MQPSPASGVRGQISVSDAEKRHSHHSVSFSPAAQELIDSILGKGGLLFHNIRLFGGLVAPGSRESDLKPKG